MLLIYSCLGSYAWLATSYSLHQSLPEIFASKAVSPRPSPVSLWAQHGTPAASLDRDPWAEPFILGHGAQPERRPPPHLSRTARSWGSWCYTIPRWPASGSGFGMQQCSSLAAIYWKPALDTRVCKRINNNNRKIQKKNTNNKNERKKKKLILPKVHTPPTHVYLQLRQRFLDQCFFSLLWIWANCQVRVTVTNHS